MTLSQGCESKAPQPHMTKLNLYTSPHMQLSVDEARQMLEWRWTAHFAPSKQLRASLENICATLKSVGARRWLLDHTHMKVVGPEDQDWIVSTWLPSWIRDTNPDTRCRVAVVNSRDHFGRISTVRIVKRVMASVGDLSVEIFDDLQSAEHWLNQDDTESNPARSAS